MKTLNKLFIGVIAITAMTSCNNELNNQSLEKSAKVNFFMGIGTTQPSRTAMEDNNYTATFQANDEVGIFVKNVPSYSNLKFTTSDGTNWSGPTVNISEGSEYTYYAYYPYVEGNTTSINYLVATNQETEGFIKNDFLYSTATSSNTIVQLPYNHALSLVEVTLAGPGAEAGATVNLLNVNIGATIDLSTQTVTSKDTIANITMDALETPLKYRAIIPAQKIKASTPIFQISSAGKTYQAKYSGEINFEQGKYLAMSITLGEKAEITINVNSSINDWTEGTDNSGNASINITEMNIPLPTEGQFTTIDKSWSPSTASQQIPQTDSDGWYKRSGTATPTTVKYDEEEQALTIANTEGVKGGWNNDNVTFHTQTPFEQGYYTLSFDVKANQGITGGIVGVGIASSNDNKLFQIVNNSWADWQRTVTTFGSLTGNGYVTKSVNFNFNQGSTTGKSSGVADFSNTEITDVYGGINIMLYNYSEVASTLYIKNIRITKGTGPEAATE